MVLENNLPNKTLEYRQSHHLAADFFVTLNCKIRYKTEQMSLPVVWTVHFLISGSLIFADRPTFF